MSTFTATVSKSVCALAALAVLLAGCSFKNKSEKEADRITQAVIANNMDPVMKDFDSQLRAKITPIRVAQYSTELRDAGKYKGIKEVAAATSTPGEHDFEATFDKHVYTEVMVLDDDGHVRAWHFHVKDAAPVPATAP
ncbi:MAG: hypothetical protein M3126_07950 [Candidatus Eremiobacteraeota bacterium]|nr:hypothetical protein [Candidatus Eremiobacteraeota bacterium]